MQQNATPQDVHDLSSRQTRVLSALLAGATITSAAKTAAVDRTTVHRWLREDFAFQAACNRLRRELQRELEARLERAVRAAAETVCAAVEAGDLRASLAVLRGTGVLSGARPAIGPEDAAELENETQAEAEGRVAARLLRRLGV